MIINSLCNTCLQPFTLIVEPGEVYLVKEISDDTGTTCPCPRKCGGAINLIGDPVIGDMSKDPRLKDPMTISGTQLYKAVMGLGLPDEIPKSEILVDSLLRASPIVKTLTETDGKHVYLHEITLENGSTIHLGSGRKGAQVLKVTKGGNDAR